MTATGKNVYYDVLDDIVNEYNNTKHSTIKMKPIDVRDDTTKSSSIARNKRVYIDEHNEKDSRFKVALDDKIDKVDKKIPNVSNLATKSSVIILVRDLDDKIDKLKIHDYAKKN